ncbi:hypothetical protein HC928_23280 [bacterium]|nr:hypothetical protein [bacterium]
MNGLRHRQAQPVQALQRGELVHQPGSMLDLLAVAGFLRHRPFDAQRVLADGFPIGGQHLAPGAVGAVVAKLAEHTRAVDLRRHQVEAGAGVGLAAVDTGLLAALDLRQHIRDEVQVVERAQRLQQPCRLVLAGLVGRLEAAFKPGGVREVRYGFRLGVARHRDLARLAFAAGLAVRLQRVQGFGVGVVRVVGVIIVQIMCTVIHDGRVSPYMVLMWFWQRG